MDPEELIARAHVVALPMRERFRGITVREAVLIEGIGRWSEWSPFVEYADVEASTWLRATLAELQAPALAAQHIAKQENRGRQADSPHADPSIPVSAGQTAVSGGIRVNATVPAIAAPDVPALLARFPGVRTAKVKVAERGQSLPDDLERVAAVRDALGPTGRIRVDANGLWTVDEAETALRALARYDLEYAEQPVASVPELAELRARIHPLVPIAADESIRKAEDPLAVVRAGAADVVVLKLQPLGGATTALGIAEAVRAEAPDVRFVTSSALETSVGLAAAARFAGEIDARFASDLDHGLGTAALFEADVAADPLLPVDGAVPLRDVHPDAALLDRWAAAPERREWWLERLRRCLALAAPTA